jgi:hypothetical protein
LLSYFVGFHDDGLVAILKFFINGIQADSSNWICISFFRSTFFRFLTSSCAYYPFRRKKRSAISLI